MANALHPLGVKALEPGALPSFETDAFPCYRHALNESAFSPTVAWRLTSVHTDGSRSEIATGSAAVIDSTRFISWLANQSPKLTTDHSQSQLSAHCWNEGRSYINSDETDAGRTGRGSLPTTEYLATRRLTHSQNSRRLRRIYRQIRDQTNSCSICIRFNSERIPLTQPFFVRDIIAVTTD